MRAEISSLRADVRVLRAELFGCAVAALYQSISVVGTHSQTGTVDPTAVAERIETLLRAGGVHGDAASALDASCRQFVEMLHAMPVMAAGTWRAPKPTHLRVVTDPLPP